MASPNALTFLTNNILLPPQLPQSDEDESGAIELFNLAQDCARQYAAGCTGSESEVWTKIASCIGTWKWLYDEGIPCESQIKTNILGMKVDDVLLFNVSSQNAAVILRKVDSGVIFECFELSPKNENVLAAQNSLRWTFPSKAILLPHETIQDVNFVQEFSSAIQKLTTEQPRLSMETTTKSGQVVTEERQSANPKLVSEWLFGSVLAQVGEPWRSKTVVKRTHVDVCWNNAARPWRRSPLWLALRVTLQLFLANSRIADDNHTQYKNFMVLLVVKLAQRIVRNPLTTPEILHVLRVKLARRSAKLKSHITGFVHCATQLAMTDIHEFLTREWKAAQDTETVSLPKIPYGSPELGLQLRQSKSMLTKVLTRFRQKSQSLSPHFSAPRSSRCKLEDHRLPPAEIFTRAGDDDLLVLVQFETWVEKNLTASVQSSNHKDATCTHLKSLLEAYYSLSSNRYKGYPDRMSVMFLTILELWVAMDQIVTKLYPLLLQYSPEIPEAYLEPLLLPQLKQMERVFKIERYLRVRHLGQISSNPSVFGHITSRSFSVTFFGDSTALRSLRSEIEAEATQAKGKKTIQWKDLTNQYNQQLARAEEMECGEFIPRTGRNAGRPRHDKYCRRCKLKEKAAEMKIEKHEWPLPSDESACRAAVFELDPPEAFIRWRDTTWMLLYDITDSQMQKGEIAKGTLLEYPPLKNRNRLSARRLVLASETKSFYKAHYFKSRLGVDDIFVTHGMKYSLADSLKYGVWTNERAASPSLKHFCKIKVPSGPYGCLENEFNFTEHSQNHVLAKQSNCHVEMSIHDYLAIGDLRADERLQWQKFLRELLSSNVNFGADTVLLLIQQLAWQLGAAENGSPLRAAHFDFADHIFCSKLVHALEFSFARIEASWKEMTYATILLWVAQRLLSIGESPELKTPSLQLIRRMRCAFFAWLSQLTELCGNKINATQMEASEEEYLRVLQAAILCRSTWNVDADYQASLFADSVDIAEYIQCSIIIHVHTSMATAANDHILKDSKLRDKVLAIKLESIVAECLQRDNNAFSAGISCIIQQSSFRHEWKKIEGVDQRWIMNLLQGTKTPVHYNIISGELLVSGRPISYLPAKYVDDPIYRATFGTKVFEVFSSDVPEMEFMTAKLFSGYRIYFGIMFFELVIRSRIGSTFFEAIPQSCFAGDMPSSLLREVKPWINLNDSTVEFRQTDSQFQSLPKNWILFFNGKTPETSRMRQGKDRYLIDWSSEAGRAICSILEPIETRENIHIIWLEGVRVDVLLPRYRLSFHVRWDGTLLCRELSAELDMDQSVKCLHGLSSRMVFRTITGNESIELRRFVMVPYGNLHHEKCGNHVRVAIKGLNDEIVPFFQYKIDSRLGQLRADGDLEGHLYKAYLHAVTSSVMPDLLTGRTGTEEALLCLSDSLTRSSLPFSNRSQDILKNIGNLTPVRCYYPKGLKTMQTVQLLNTHSAYFQHDHFAILVNEITSHNAKSNFLFDGNKTQVYKYQGEDLLLLRSLNRNRKYYAVNSTQISKPIIRDDEYISRDHTKGDSLHAAFRIASYIHNWQSRLFVKPEIFSLLKSWGEIEGFGTAFSFTAVSQHLSLELKNEWPKLFAFCRTRKFTDHKWQMLFKFSLMVFGNRQLEDDLTTLLAFAMNEKLRALKYPSQDSYDLDQGDRLDETTLTAIISACTSDFEPSFSSDSEPDDAVNVLKAEKKTYDERLENQKALLMRAILDCWPSDRPNLPGSRSLSLFDYPVLKTALSSRFAIWHKNFVFRNLCQEYTTVLRVIHTRTPSITLPCLDLPADSLRVHGSPSIHFSLLDVMQQVDASNFRFVRNWKLDNLDGRCARSLNIVPNRSDQDELLNQKITTELLDITASSCGDQDHITLTYNRSLFNSVLAWKSFIKGSGSRIQSPKSKILHNLRALLKESLESLVLAFVDALGPRTPWMETLSQAGLWPQISTYALLQLLSRKTRSFVPKKWLQHLIRFGRHVTALQRMDRLIRFTASSDYFAFHREVENEAHEAWNVEEHLDWLLLEIQNDLLIRSVQIQVAEALMKLENQVLLLGMGEGKTSVILPMLITSLADGASLLRVVVLKSLATEMIQSLSHTLSGVVGRIVYNLPFSRRTALKNDAPDQIFGLYQDCMKNNGVLVTLPEYLNSFRLIGIDKLSSRVSNSDTIMATGLLRLQKWLDCNARDILDESDELLKPAYELVYTNQAPCVLSGASDRWSLVLEVLSLIKRNADKVHLQFPLDIEYESRVAGAFPHVRVLSEVGGKVLTQRLLEEIKSDGLPSFPLGHCNPEVLECVIRFISILDVEDDSFDVALNHFSGLGRLDSLYLLRGLIAYNIMPFALKKRWLVNYGLDRSRCLSAVPYRAKSVPSAAAEFAQPETMIVLTAMSYYYVGITITDLRQCIILLLKTPDASDEYADWIAGSYVPTQYGTFNAVNVEDSNCVEQLFIHLRRAKRVIDFFLKHFVFPREAKEFPFKLSSSAWDLCANDTPKITSGFSGTCDSLLPLSIVQKDLASLKHTDASVLAALLTPRNREYYRAASESNQRLTTDQLLRFIVDKINSVSVIIDVGAQFLETNDEIASKWLALDASHEKKAVVYFNDRDTRMVLSEDGTAENWMTSPFRDSLAKCLIYLDEFRTRGTDFILPDNFVAVVLLGPGLQKDALVQACMRMRKLAFSQKIVFVANPEIDNSIRALLKKSLDYKVTSPDVIRWAIHQTCLSLQHQRPLWISRGQAYCTRRNASLAHISSDGVADDPIKYVEKVRERESRPVSEIYKVPRRASGAPPTINNARASFDEIERGLFVQCQRLEITELEHCGKEEEQEREVLHEVEQEREVQRPKGMRPILPSINEHLFKYIKTGNLTGTMDSLRQAFPVLLSQTSVRPKLDLSEWPKDLTATDDFIRTVLSIGKSPLDDFLRPVNWLLQPKCWNGLILISPHEANEFLPEIRRSPYVKLYVYAPRTTKSMSSFDSLELWYASPAKGFPEISPVIRTALRLLSGHLYFNSFNEYQRTCSLLGLWDGEKTLDKGPRSVSNDGFVVPACREANGWKTQFKTSPVEHVKKFIAMRRKGIEWSHTHMGRVLNGGILKRREFE